MSDTLETLRRKIDGAGQLESVVRTMKALAAANIGQYERAVLALAGYYRTVELGLAACLRQKQVIAMPAPSRRTSEGSIVIIVFGSDQGLVGQFNDELAAFVAARIGALPGQKTIWAVGERIYARLEDSGLPPEKLFAVPNSVTAITPLVGQILVESESRREKGELEQVYIFHNRPKTAAFYEHASQRLLPLDEGWRREIHTIAWPTKNLPEVAGAAEPALLALIREYLFVSLFRACAESLASENASRLAAMQRAEKNIRELSEDLTLTFQRLRQSSIDEELFDVFSGFSALSNPAEAR
jgi:F-type H+-transporting ATPase subunit gamma